MIRLRSGITNGLLLTSFHFSPSACVCENEISFCPNFRTTTFVFHFIAFPFFYVHETLKCCQNPNPMAKAIKWILGFYVNPVCMPCCVSNYFNIQQSTYKCSVLISRPDKAAPRFSSSFVHFYVSSLTNVNLTLGSMENEIYVIFFVAFMCVCVSVHLNWLFILRIMQT